MHWIAFAILLYVVTVLQSSGTPLIAVRSIQPDLLVIMAVHYALLARPLDAMIACWFIGFAIDLASLSFSGHSNVGVNAFTLGLIGFCIVKIRELTFRENAVTQVLFTSIAKFALSLLVGMHMLHAIDQWNRFGEILSAAIGAAIYTGILAPYAHWALRKLRAPLGLGMTHRLRVR